MIYREPAEDIRAVQIIHGPQMELFPMAQKVPGGNPPVSSKFQYTLLIRITGEVSIHRKKGGRQVSNLWVSWDSGFRTSSISLPTTEPSLGGSSRCQGKVWGANLARRGRKS